MKLLFIFLALASIARAEDADTTALPKQYIIASPMDDEFSERTLTAPFTQVKPQSLQLTSPNFESLFNTVSSVQSRSSGSPVTSIRGSSQAARVLFVLDDIPLNFLDGFGGSSLFVPTEILKTINIFEGPSSAQYGSSALGGVVHFVSDLRHSSLLRVGLSDTDTSFIQDEGTLSTANIAAAVPVIDGESYHLQASTFLQKDRGDYPFIASDGKKDRRRDNGENLHRFTLIGHAKAGDLRLSHLLIYSGLNKRTPGSVYFPGNTDQSADALLAAVSTNYKLSPTTMWTSRVSYAQLHSDFLNAASTFSSAYTSYSNSDKFWLNQGLTWEFLPGWLSQTLFELNRNKYRASFAAADGTSLTEPEFAQTFVIPVTDRLTIEPTGRYLTKYEETLFQLNIPYRFDNAKIWAMYSEGFRPPALIDLYAKDPGYVGNPDLTPEKSRQYEVGFAWNMQNFDISSSIYRIDYENLIQGKTTGFVFSKINAGEAESTGTTTKFTADFNPLIFHVGYSSLLARETANHQPLTFSPKHQLFSSLTYQRDTWSAALQQSEWSRFQDNNSVSGGQARIAPWSSTDVLFFTKLSKQMTGSFGVYNVFDHRRELGFGYPEPQRRTALTLEYNF